MAYIKGGARKGRKKVCQFCVEKAKALTTRMFLSLTDIHLKELKFFLAV